MPNLTEAALLTGMEYREIIDEDYVNTLIRQLDAPKVVLTGVGLQEGFTGVLVRDGVTITHYPHKKVGGSCHGTGDIFAACFTGSLMCGKNMEKSVEIAAEITALAINNTVNNPAHWYGVKFETVLPDLIRMLENA
jgi:pyridoxine kinase